MTKPKYVVHVAAGLTFFLAIPQYAFAFPPTAPTVEWIRQFGTSGYEVTASVSADILGNVFVAGQTGGTFSGPPIGAGSIFLRKYDAAGASSWTRQIAPQESNGRGVVAADGLGNVYVGGDTTGNVSAPNTGFTDYFLRKYDASGNVLWTRQAGSISYDYLRDATVDQLGNLYLVGYTAADLAGPNLGEYDAFLLKYDSLGNRLWTRQIGTSSHDIGQGLATDPLGNIYVTGYTTGNFAAPYAGGEGDMFFAKYDANGNELWKRQLGTASFDAGYDAAADPFGNVYLIGYSDGVMAAGAPGFGDVVLIRFDSAGNQIWTRQFGTAQQDLSSAAAIDGLGNIYMGGTTGGALGAPSAGPHDAFAVKYLVDGTLGWSYQIGSAGYEFQYGLSHDGHGNVYLSGTTEGVVGAGSAGGTDAFLVKLHDNTFVPEPTTIAQACLLALFGCRWRHRAGR